MKPQLLYLILPIAMTSAVVSADPSLLITSVEYGFSRTEREQKKNREESAESFIQENYESIRAEAAKGDGDHLDTVAEILIRGSRDRDSFKEKLKDNHIRIFKRSAKKSAARVIELAERYE